jgi:hypothetical protein
MVLALVAVNGVWPSEASEQFAAVYGVERV